MKAIPLGPWPAGMNLRARDAALEAGEARLIMNLDVEDAGGLRARPALAATTVAAPAHSLRAHADRLFFVSAGRLCAWVPGAATAHDLGFVGRARMAWGTLNGELFGSNGAVCVRFNAVGARAAWGISSTYYDANGVELTAPTPAPLLACWGGFVLTGKDNALRWTAPFAPDATDALRNVLYLDAPLQCIAPTNNGVWVSSRDTSWLLQGTDPAQWRVPARAQVGAIGPDAIHDPAKPDKVIWLSEGGFVEGDAQGNLQQPNRARISVSSERPAHAGLIHVAGLTRYIGILDGAGLPETINRAAVAAVI